MRLSRSSSAPARRILPVLAISTAALMVAGCAASTGDAPTPTSAGEPVAGGSLTFARLSQEVTSLDPHDAVLTTINAYTLDKVFDTLYALDETGTPQPSLATSYELSDDGLTWTFALREGVTFSDGSAFDADDVVYSIDRHREVGGALPLSAPIAEVTSADPLSVTIVLSEPYTPLLSELSIFSSSILPSELADQDAAAFFADPVGTGPFVVGEWDKASGDLTLARNDQYWVKGLPYLDEVKLVALDDDNQLVQQLKAGQVQIIDDVPIANVEELKADAGLAVQSVPSWNSDIIYFNTASPVFSDLAVRQAVAQAIDREAIVAATTFGTATPAKTYISTSIQYSDQTVDTLPLDQAAAKAALEASGKAGSTVTLTVDGGSQARTQQAQIIQSALTEIGLTVEIKSVDNATFWSVFPAGDYDFALSTTIADTGDPDNVSSWQVFGQGKDTGAFFTNFDDDDINALVLQGRTTPDGDERAAIYAELQERVAHDLPQFPIGYVAEIKATSADVHGLQLIPNGTVRLERTWIDQK